MTLGLKSLTSPATHTGKPHTDNIVCGSMVNSGRGTVGFYPHVLSLPSGITTQPDGLNLRYTPR